MNDIEKQIRLDLEMALAQVQATIKAECRVTKFQVLSDSFFVRMVVGENYGLARWDYPVESNNAHTVSPAGRVRLIPVQSFELAINTDLKMYRFDEHPLIEQTWNQMVVQIVNRFFHENPEYRLAIS